MSRPLVSVLLPLRDAAATLVACLRSLQSQTLADFEIVAVDHASSDSTPGVLRRYASGDSRIRVIPSRAASLPLALNDGLEECRGEFVARMDADDFCVPERLEKQAALLQSRPELGIVGSWVEVFSESGEVSPAYRDYEDWVNSLVEDAELRRELFIECPLPHPSWMVPREVYERLGGYRDEGAPEDYDFVLRASEAGYKLAKVPEMLLAWRDHPLRHSRTHARYGRQPFMRLRAHYLKSMVIGERPCCLWGAGDRGRLLARFLLEEGSKIEFVVGLAQGENPPSLVHGIPVIPPEAVPATLPGPLIACVGAPGAREEIRRWISGRGLVEGIDAWFAS